MISCRIEVDDFLADLAKCEQNLDQALGFAWAEQGASAAQACKHNGYKDRTGNLSNSMNYAVQRTGPLGYRVIVSAGAYYALWVDEKTKPHIIRARYAQYLRFVIDGTVFFRKFVRHPGTKGADWSTRVRLQYGMVNIPQALQAAVDRVAAAA